MTLFYKILKSIAYENNLFCSIKPYIISFSLIVQIQIGQDIHGDAAWDNSGRSVSLNQEGSIITIRATGNAQNGRH